MPDAPLTGVLSALPEEQRGLEALLHDAKPAVQHAGRRFVSGWLGDTPVVLALSGIGKVAAAATTAALAERFGIRQLVFTGVAGGLAGQARVGDIVVASAFLQHDMDASPLFPRHEVPLYGQARFPADADLGRRLLSAARGVLEGHRPWDAATSRRFGLEDRRVHHGLLASGDRFVSALSEAADLRAAVPDAWAVDMESAAVAQVCRDYGLPFAAMRMVSDRADEQAHVDFPAFVSAVAGPVACAVLAVFFRA